MILLWKKHRKFMLLAMCRVEWFLSQTGAQKSSRLNFWEICAISWLNSKQSLPCVESRLARKQRFLPSIRAVLTGSFYISKHIKTITGVFPAKSLLHETIRWKPYGLQPSSHLRLWQPAVFQEVLQVLYNLAHSCANGNERPTAGKYGENHGKS